MTKGLICDILILFIFTYFFPYYAFTSLLFLRTLRLSQRLTCMRSWAVRRWYAFTALSSRLWGMIQLLHTRWNHWLTNYWTRMPAAYLQTPKSGAARCSSPTEVAFAQTFFENGNPAFVARLIASAIPTLSDIGFPESAVNLINADRGLVPRDRADRQRKVHHPCRARRVSQCDNRKNIVTLEDPIEYVFSSKKSLVKHRRSGAISTRFPKASNTSFGTTPT